MIHYDPLVTFLMLDALRHSQPQFSTSMVGRYRMPNRHSSRSSTYVALYFTGLICQDHPEAYLPTSNIWVIFWETASALVGKGSYKINVNVQAFSYVKTLQTKKMQVHKLVYFSIFPPPRSCCVF